MFDTYDIWYMIYNKYMLDIWVEVKILNSDGNFLWEIHNVDKETALFARIILWPRVVSYWAIWHVCEWISLVLKDFIMECHAISYSSAESYWTCIIALEEVSGVDFGGGGEAGGLSPRVAADWWMFTADLKWRPATDVTLFDHHLQIEDYMRLWGNQISCFNYDGPWLSRPTSKR